uniref:Membrane-associated tyrosine- and threonine-specific cdc2-inhibitory kinase n=1 Tax=Tetranychus urticae TaxID=32264 RepID=T1JYP1_TETUR
MVDNTPNIRPVPHFFNENVFLSKKARSSTPCKKKIPPRPPCKSLPPKGRLFSDSKTSRAQAVSFKESDFSTLSKDYDETRSESYFQQCFKIEKKIGSGSFGNVYKCISKDDGKYYAIKKSRERYKGKSDRDRRLQEVAKHEQLPGHPNLVKFYKAWEENGYLYIQTELCDCSLSEFLEINHDIAEPMVWNFLADLLSALKHLHERDLIHLDIKPDNIFISKDGLFKLGDFGLVVKASEIDIDEVTEGDPKYLAKELMQGKFTKAADIFSLGITTLELACDLEVPSNGNGWHQLREGKMPEHFFNKLTPELRKVILNMMHPDYKRRWTAEELLEYPPISRISRKRRYWIKWRSSLNFISDCFQWFIIFLMKIFLLSFVFSFIKKKFPHRRNSGSRTPPRKNFSPDWDQSFSDDDVFENSFLFSPLHDEMNSSFMSDRHLISDSFINNPNRFTSTASKIKRQSNLSTSSYMPLTPLRRSLFSNERPSLIARTPGLQDSFNERISFCDLSDDDDELNITNQMCPKNLEKIFDKMENEEDAVSMNNSFLHTF